MMTVTGDIFFLSSFTSQTLLVFSTPTTQDDYCYSISCVSLLFFRGRKKQKLRRLQNVFWITLIGRGWRGNDLTLIVCDSQVSAHPTPYTLQLGKSTCCLGPCFRSKLHSPWDLQPRTNNRPVRAQKANLLFPPLPSRVGNVFSSAFSRSLAYLVVSAPLGRPCPAPGLVNRQGVGAGMEFWAGPDEIMLPLRCKSIPEDQRSSG